MPTQSRGHGTRQNEVIGCPLSAPSAQFVHLVGRVADGEPELIDPVRAFAGREPAEAYCDELERIERSKTGEFGGRVYDVVTVPLEGTLPRGGTLFVVRLFAPGA